MITPAVRLWVLAALGCLTAAAAQAGTGPTKTFDWNPRAVGLNGAKFTADTMRLSDFGQIVVTPAPPTGGVTTFTEAGYLPILGFSLDGQAVMPSGFDAASGKGWGAYLQYEGKGTQSLTPDGIVAEYSSLNYSIYGFNGLATYGFDTTGAAQESGGTNLTLLGDGSLITGSVTLVPAGFIGTTPAFDVNGQIQTTIGDVPHQLSSYTFLGLDVNVVHPPGELSPTSPTTFKADGGSSSTATVITGRGHSVHTESVALFVPVPEPGSGWLFAVGVVPVVLLCRRGRA